MATRNIRVGEELCAHYGNNYWQAIQAKMKQDMTIVKLQRKIDAIADLSCQEVTWL